MVEDHEFRFEMVAREKRAPLRLPTPPPVTVTGELRDRHFDKHTVHAFFDAATVSRVVFDRMRFLKFLARGSTFVECDFRKVTSSAVSSFSVRPQSLYRSCRFDGADLRHFDPGSARFEGCSFDGARLDGWRSAAAEFIDCSFSGRVRDVVFWGRPHALDAKEVGRQVNEFRGNDLRQAELLGTDFAMGIDIGAQRWPEGPQYIRLGRMTERLRRTRAEVIRWTDDPAARRRALSILDVLNRDVANGQEELFTNRNDLGGDRPELRDRLWVMLAAELPPGTGAAAPCPDPQARRPGFAP